MLIVGAGIGIALLRQIAVVLFTPWEADYSHWSSIVLLIIVFVGLPLLLVWRRWRYGPDYFRELRRSTAAQWSVTSWTTPFSALWVGIALALIVLYNYHSWRR